MRRGRNRHRTAAPRQMIFLAAYPPNARLNIGSNASGLPPVGIFCSGPSCSRLLRSPPVRKMPSSTVSTRVACVGDVFLLAHSQELTLSRAIHAPRNVTSPCCQPKSQGTSTDISSQAVLNSNAASVGVLRKSCASLHIN